MRRVRPTTPLPAVPWHLKLLGLALAVYLLWRFLQMLSWVL
ncbi:MAG: hypothetical protein KatS3mg010_0255 [Acidimicrobiia bacterium]|nr:MAG: hypothetical protein KatS3mg010_0255 [Acidimicrobiia bacterium]